MNTLNLLISTVFVFAAASAQANNNSYTCQIKGNPGPGLKFEFDLEITDLKIGGDFVIKADGKSKKVGTVTDVTYLKSNVATDSAAFDLALRNIANPDISGISEETLKTITSIEVYKDRKSENEVTVLRLFAQGKQVGGSVFIDREGTSCF